MKQPFAYYGGKAKMIKHILPLIPKHKIYCEPFCGGASVFWHKEPVKIEVLNDKNELIVNFYRVLKTQQEALFKLIDATPYARSEHKRAIELCKSDEGSEVERAWAFWVNVTMGFMRIMNKTWMASVHSSHAGLYYNKKPYLSKPKLSKRLDNVLIDNICGLETIKNYDNIDTFHYIDPPYIDTDCGHYKDYKPDDYEALLTLLTTIKGKFMLSCFESEMSNEYVRSNNWIQRSYEKQLSASNMHSDGKRTKTELIIMNYEANNELFL